MTLSVNRARSGADDWISFTISDTGIGMTPEEIAKMFDPFVQADASTTRQYGGTGLGLALSQRFARMLGGRITAESQKGVGSVFELRLPANTAHEGATQPEISAPTRPPDAQSRIWSW